MSLPESTFSHSIIVYDYGSQYNMLIVRRLRELGCYSLLVHPDTPWQEIGSHHPTAFILSGGPQSVYDPNALKLPPEILESGLPVLGICYGMQLLTHTLGGKVEKHETAEYGPALVDHQQQAFFAEIQQPMECWMSHQDHVCQPPQGFEVLAKSGEIIAGIAHKDKPIFGLQFHPEVSHTPQGSLLLDNFLRQAGIQKDWNQAQFVQERVQAIASQYPSEKIALGISGGVDSTVTAALLQKAVGDRLLCMFVDTGLMRLNEGDQVMEALSELGAEIHRIDAKERFFQALKGVSEPESKRKIIGHTFIEVFREFLKAHPEIKTLAQGTLYPDIIESGHGQNQTNATIKTHHNVGGLPQDLKLEILEPLADLFKDEVRQVGLELGLSAGLVYRQPFPGPGLGVRVIGEVTAEKVDILQRADRLYCDLIEQRYPDFQDRPWQYYAALLPVKTVGVTGDHRRLGWAIDVRAVCSEDAMTASVFPFEHEFLEKISTTIVNSVPEVSRVLYDITPKPPATIEWE